METIRTSRSSEHKQFPFTCYNCEKIGPGKQDRKWKKSEKNSEANLASTNENPEENHIVMFPFVQYVDSKKKKEAIFVDSAAPDHTVQSNSYFSNSREIDLLNDKVAKNSLEFFCE